MVYYLDNTVLDMCCYDLHVGTDGKKTTTKNRKMERIER